MPSASDIKTATKVLQGLLSNPSELSSPKLVGLVSLAKSVAAAAENVPEQAESSEDDMPDLEDDVPAPSCKSGCCDDDKPAAAPAPTPAAAAPPAAAPPAPSIEDSGIYAEETDPAPPSFKNATDAEAEALSDDAFGALQDGVNSSKAAAAEAGTPGDAVDHLTKAIENESKLGQLSAMTIAKRSEQLLKCKRVSAALADADA